MYLYSFRVMIRVRVRVRVRIRVRVMVRVYVRINAGRMYVTPQFPGYEKAVAHQFLGG